MSRQRRADRLTTGSSRVAVMVCLAALSACGLPLASPVSSTEVAVTPVADAAKTLQVKDGMVFYDNLVRPSRGIKFPEGTYVLEAQDGTYWYFRAPVPIEMRTFLNGTVDKSHTAFGGVMFAKSLPKTLHLPAAGYVDRVDGDAVNKIQVWKLGNEFLQLQGRQWTKSF